MIAIDKGAQAVEKKNADESLSSQKHKALAKRDVRKKMTVEKAALLKRIGVTK
jgi:hypothetical protein